MNGADPRYGLGRLIAPDPRDHNYLLPAAPVPPARSYRIWYDNGWWGDQGANPHCVGYAWAHFVEDSPRTHPQPGAHVDPVAIYIQAQKIDEWPGESYNGTSVRAGAKALQAQGVIGEYRWAFDPDSLARHVIEGGPVVMGTDWHEGMFTPDSRGRLHLDGAIVGGHAWIINGFNRNTKMFRMKNSWGRAWGKEGRASIHFDDVAQLLIRDGEACMAVEP